MGKKVFGDDLITPFVDFIQYKLAINCEVTYEKCFSFVFIGFSFGEY